MIALGLHRPCSCKNSEILASVTSIVNDAFNGCRALSSIEISASMTRIGGGAFTNCHSLANVTIYAPSPAGYAHAFELNANGRKIYVFNNCIDNWGNDRYVAATEPITLAANEGATGQYWTTYYNELADAKVPDGARAFKVTLSGTTLALTEIEDGIISLGTAVVIKSPSASVLPEYSETASSDTGGNDLHGTSTAITNPGNAYVLNKKSAGVGFYKLKSTGPIGAHKAYLTYDGNLAREHFAFDEATGIDVVDSGQWIVPATPGTRSTGGSSTESPRRRDSTS